MKPTRILLADDHKIVREGLRTLIAGVEDFEVVGETDNGLEAAALAEKLRPDIAILDIGMPGLNGIEAAHRIRECSPDTRIVTLSMHSDRHFVLGALRNGAKAYLLKDSAFEELIHAVRSVRDNRTYLSARITDIVVRDYVAAHANVDAPSAQTLLSVREREVLQLLAEGKATKQIAFLLHISVKTVETYRQQLMEKLGLHSIAELTKYAIREGITTL